MLACWRHEEAARPTPGAVTATPPPVGVVANPASGRDIRRLTTGASVFDNAEKGNMVRRLMAGLGAVGVERVLMMPAGDGLGQSLERGLRGQGRHGPDDLPELEVLEMRVRGEASDTTAAVRAMRERGVGAIVVLGGDGTHRVVAGEAGDVPLCALSTGTNNAFPELREATVAGLAAGLVATGRVTGGLRREQVLSVTVDGEEGAEWALVDVAASAQRFVGARALTRLEDLHEFVVAFGAPGGVGLSGVAGLLDPAARAQGHGLHVRLAPPGATPERVVAAPVAPGLVARVPVAEIRRVAPGEAVAFPPRPGCLALDGERERELRGSEEIHVLLDPGGPRTIDVGAVMAEAAARGLLGRAPSAPARGEW